MTGGAADVGMEDVGMMLIAGLALVAFQTSQSQIPAMPMTDADMEAAARRLQTRPGVPDSFFPNGYPVAAAAESASPQATGGSISDYVHCVSDTAERFDASGEPVTVVVQAAQAACRHLQSDTAAAGSQLAQLPPERFQALMAEFRDTVGTRVLARLVALRACRNTSGCQLGSVPPAFEDLPPRSTD